MNEQGDPLDDVMSRHVSDIDQDMAASREHIGVLTRMMADQLRAGSSAEREFVRCVGSAISQDVSQGSLSAMLAAAILELAQGSASGDRLSEFTIRRSDAHGGCYILGHRKCRRDVHYIAEELEPSPAHFNGLARVHLQGCL
jgi:hypothetical protein